MRRVPRKISIRTFHVFSGIDAVSLVVSLVFAVVLSGWWWAFFGVASAWWLFWFWYVGQHDVIRGWGDGVRTDETWRAAIGAVPTGPDDLSAEDAIRKIRGGQ